MTLPSMVEEIGNSRCIKTTDQHHGSKIPNSILSQSLLKIKLALIKLEMDILMMYGVQLKPIDAHLTLNGVV